MPSQDEVEEFAALLRRLKARTDRSYAALARRLNMNASTLHRYCTGDTVPLGFASVERFAAMCEATPAERIELHRRWVLAVAARQRPRTEDAGARPAGGEGPADDGAAELTPRAAAVPVATTAAEIVPSAPSGPSPGPSPGPRRTPADSLAGSSREHDPTPPATPPAPRSWRRATVAAAVVTATIATLGSLSLLLSGHSGATGDKRASGTTITQAAGVRHHTPAPSASASSTRGRPTGAPSPKAPPVSERSTSPSPKASARVSPAAAPLTWTSDSQLWDVGCMHDYVIDKPPQQVPPPPAPQDATPWARTQGAVHGGRILLSISVQGRTDTAVVLEALRVRVIGRAAPVKGTVYFTGQGCGSDISPRSFAVNLDKDRPIARPVPGNDSGTTTPALQMPYRVSSKDPEVLFVDARTTSCDCRWYLELDWSSQGRTGTERIDDHGLPFRTSSIEGLPHYWYANRKWTPITS
ncbi:helix-turn-helix transcriptional regulator [Streptomyces sp. NPDC046977]|uniref:helix-turn-helix domain-containing protein n=1 Tax=Streptomyces sp. NPDC046977 TaxID=3154703 RepID=UPI0033CDE4DD